MNSAFDAAHDAERVDRGAKHQLERHVADGRQVPHLLAGQVAGDRLLARARRQRRMVRGGAEHHHLVHAAERHDARLDADHRIGAGSARLGCNAAERKVAGGVEDVAELLDLAAASALQRSEEAAPMPIE